MRRMYSEQELTNVIKAVFEAELASGALDELVSNAVDAYLVEHPVDVTALEGQDVELASLDATGLITGGEIVEKMSGYSFTSGDSPNVTYNNVYCGVVKNGNKLTMVTCLTFTLGSSYTALSISLGSFIIPASVFAKLYPFRFAGSLDLLNYSDVIVVNVSSLASINSKEYAQKVGTNSVKTTINTTGLSLETEYFVRIEHTYLLSDNLAPEE